MGGQVLHADASNPEQQFFPTPEPCVLKPKVAAERKERTLPLQQTWAPNQHEQPLSSDWRAR